MDEWSDLYSVSERGLLSLSSPRAHLMVGMLQFKSFTQTNRACLVTLLDAGSRVECPRNINRLKKKHDLWYDDL